MADHNDNGNKNETDKKTRLADSAYLSPYSQEGAPKPHPNINPYAPLRASALSTLEALGYDPSTMVERGVVWAEGQDPFGHVMHSQFMHFLGACFYRFMESYSEFLSEQEYDDMIYAKTVVPVIRKYELDIRRQVKYPDSVCITCPLRLGLIAPSSANQAGSPNSSSLPTGRIVLSRRATAVQRLFSLRSSKLLLPRSKAL